MHQLYAKKIPIEIILLESDAPFLKPFPEMELNKPQNIIYSAREVATLKNMDVEIIAKITTQNTRDFFNLPR